MMGRALRPLALLTLLAAGASFAQASDGGTEEAVKPLAVSAKVSADHVKLGEPFTYRITVTHTPDQRWELHAPGNLGDFDLLSQTRHRVDGKQHSSTTFDLKMGLYALGDHVLPDLRFDVTDPKGTRSWVQHGVKISGVSTLAKDAKKNGANLYDVKPNEPLPVRTWRLLWVFLAIAALVACAWGLVVWVRRLRARASLAPPPPPAPLHERTLAALNALKNEALHTNGKTRDHYFRLSDILRGYVGERYSFEAKECTSTELLARAKQIDPRDFPLGEFSAFVHESDLVKFAKSDPGPEAGESALAFGFRLVEQTKRPQVVTADALGRDLP